MAAKFLRCKKISKYKKFTSIFTSKFKLSKKKCLNLSACKFLIFFFLNFMISTKNMMLAERYKLV